jgi:hypothetical protein
LPARAPRLETRVECVIDGVADRLVVDLRVTGLDPAGRDLAFELTNWGEWLELDEYYVTRVHGTPPAAHDLENPFYWRPRLPEEWDGALALHYELPIVDVGSVARQHHGLLPWRAGEYVSGYTANTLMQLLIGDEFFSGPITLELVAPAGWSAACGWGGVAPGRLTLERPAVSENSALFFGRVVASASSQGAGGRIEVTQFGAHEPRAAEVLALLESVRAAGAASFGVLPPGPERVFITEPGFGGTHTDGAITMGHPELGGVGSEIDGFGIGTAHFIAHESFHAWLPGMLSAPPEGGLEWFFEGFNDYFALWHLAAAGEVPAQEFADQLRRLEHGARESPACGKLAFADPAVNWREPAAEALAYKGGAVLAFHLDVELRTRGEPGLPRLLRDLLAAGGRYDLGILERWCAAHGLAEAWAAHVVAPTLPPIEDDLVRIGCRERREGESRILTASAADLAAFLALPR